MIFVYIFIGMILLGLVFSQGNIDSLDILGWLLFVCGSLFLIISVISIIGSHACADNDVQRNKIEYEGLRKRYEIVESDYEDVSKSDIIADITAWNIKVYNTKYWTENPWTNWFNPKKIADNLDYIPLDEESENEKW